MNGMNIASISNLPGLTDMNWSIVGSGDFNADGKPDLLMQHVTTGTLGVWFMNGTTMTSSTLLTPSTTGDPNWRVVGVSDFNGDGKPDIILENAGTIGVWIMNGTTMTSTTLFAPGSTGDPNWRIVGIK